MKPFEKARLLKPLSDEWKLEDPEWMGSDDDTLCFYVPTWFNPDEYIDGLHVNTSENEDFVNIYVSYYPLADKVEVQVYYVNHSGYDEGYDDFEIEIELDDKSADLLRTHIQRDWKEMIDDWTKGVLTCDS
jgi:hypothetical protein